MEETLESMREYIRSCGILQDYQVLHRLFDRAIHNPDKEICLVPSELLKKIPCEDIHILKCYSLSNDAEKTYFYYVKKQQEDTEDKRA